MKFYSFTLSVLSVFFLCFSTTGHAQESASSTPQTLQDTESTIIERPTESDYALGTVQNFSKLYWKLGALGVDNDKAIDHFLMINECDIHKSFYQDDFQWQEVRKAARAMIKRERPNFPDKFRFMIPIDLGRYDPVKKGFPLTSGTGVINLRRIEFGGNSYSSKICGHRGPIDLYPKNIMLILNKPLTFNFLQLDEHIAQAFIVRRKYHKPEQAQLSAEADYKRPVYLQLRTSIAHFQGIQPGKRGRGGKLAAVYGKIDAIDIYEDKGRKNLLKSISLIKKKRPITTDISDSQADKTEPKQDNVEKTETQIDTTEKAN